MKEQMDVSKPRQTAVVLRKLRVRATRFERAMTLYGFRIYSAVQSSNVAALPCSGLFPNVNWVRLYIGFSETTTAVQ
jgi:hypothetical protein